MRDNSVYIYICPCPCMTVNDTRNKSANARHSCSTLHFIDKRRLEKPETEETI